MASIDPPPLHLVCFVCHGLFTDPRILPCLHTFCSQCLAAAGGGPAGDGNGTAPLPSTEAAADGGGCASSAFLPFKPSTLICPQCSFPVPTSSIERLPINYAAREEIRQLQGLKSCHNCGQGEAIVYCPQCNGSPLCGECNRRIHVHRIFNSHRPIPLGMPILPLADSATVTSILNDPSSSSISDSVSGALASTPTAKRGEAAGVVSTAILGAAERDGGRIPIPCHRHTSHFLQQFCRQCSTALCTKCVEEDHVGHVVGTLKAALEKSVPELPKLTTVMRRTVSQCGQAEAIVNGALQDLDHCKSTCIELLETKMHHITQLLISRKHEMAHEIITEYERKRRLLMDQLETLHHRRDAATCALWLVSTLDGEAAPPAAADVKDHAAEVNGSLRLRAPDNHSAAVVADTAVHVNHVTAHAASQRVDLAPCVETQLLLSFHPEDELLEKMIQRFGHFYSKRVMEKKIPPPLSRLDALALFQERPQSRGIGGVTPTGSRMTTPRSVSPRTASVVAPFVAPLSAILALPSVAQGGDHHVDTSGLLYFYGCDGGIKAYQNPAVRGTVKVRASSIGYGKIENVVQCVPPQQSQLPQQQQTTAAGGHLAAGSVGKDFCTQNAPLSWVSIKIKAAVELDAYVLHHDSFEASSHFLRSWDLRGHVALELLGKKFRTEAQFREGFPDYTGPLWVELSEGRMSRASDPESIRLINDLLQSVDGAAEAIGDDKLPRWWILLDSRRNCDALKASAPGACFFTSASNSTLPPPEAASATASFADPVPHGVPPCDQFMLIQTGTNSSGNHHLMVSCMEFYGTLLGAS